MLISLNNQSFVSLISCVAFLFSVSLISAFYYILPSAVLGGLFLLSFSRFLDYGIKSFPL